MEAKNNNIIIKRRKITYYANDAIIISKMKTIYKNSYIDLN